MLTQTFFIYWFNWQYMCTYIVESLENNIMWYTLFFCTEKSNSILTKKSFLSTSPYGKLRLGDEPVVLFTTYSSLVAKKHGAGRGKNSSRLGQIVNWLGADFDGPLGNSFFCTETPEYFWMFDRPGVGVYGRFTVTNTKLKFKFWSGTYSSFFAGIFSEAVFSTI